MGKALDLALSVCSGSIHTDNIVHDWHKPLVVGSPEIGEILVLAYNPILHRAELEVASQASGDTIAVLSFDSLGVLLIDEQPIASQANLAEAVEAAALAAASAQQSANTATAAVEQVNDGVNAMALLLEQSQTLFAQQQTTITQQVALASQSAADASASATNVANSASQAAVSAGQAQSASQEAQARASANSGVIFPDGSRSAAAYADLARANAQSSRVAITRPLVTAGFPETFQPGHLFKRARVTGGGARVVTIPQGVWPVGAGEAWATYRLEEAGSVQFTKQAGNTTGEIIPTLMAHAVRRARYGTLASSQSLVGTIAVPAVAAGKLVIQVSVGWASVVPVTLSVSVAPTGGGTALPVTARQSARTPPLANQNPHSCTFEATLTAFAGGDLDYTIVAGPDANFLIGAAYVVANVGAGVPIVAKSETASNGSSAAVPLTACPAGGIILALGVQRGVSALFSSFSANITPLATGNLQGVPTANDNDTAKNAGWGYGVGVVPTLGDQTVQANFANANGGPAGTAICYPPATGAIQPLVNLITTGGRDTLNQLGAEATLWFVPDGRTVYVNVPAA
jgi:hypothetical protein